MYAACTPAQGGSRDLVCAKQQEQAGAGVRGGAGRAGEHRSGCSWAAQPLIHLLHPFPPCTACCTSFGTFCCLSRIRPFAPF